MTIYLDCNATTPMEPAVSEEVMKYLTIEFGNAGSRTHEYGARAKQAVQKARDHIADVVQAQRDEVIFTSGATESNNLAILGLADHGEATGKKHIISNLIEHKGHSRTARSARQTRLRYYLASSNTRRMGQP